MRARQPRRLALLLLALLAASQPAAGHGVLLSDLAGLPLCLAPDSVAAQVRGTQDDRAASEALRARLGRFLHQVVTSARIPQDCERGGFTRVNVAATWLEQDQGEPLFVYAASVQVGGRGLPLPDDPEKELPDARFYHFDSSLFLASDLDAPFTDAAAGYSEQMILTLVDAWWAEAEAHNRLRARLLFLALLASALLSLLAGRMIRHRAGRATLAHGPRHALQPHRPPRDPRRHPPPGRAGHGLSGHQPTSAQPHPDRAK